MKNISLLIPILTIYSLNIALAQAPDIVWQNTIGGSDIDYLKSIKQTTDGGYILGGFSDSGISGDKTEANQGNFDYWVVKLDDAGTVTWQKTIGGNKGDYLRSIQQTTDGGYILGGESYSGISGDKTEECQGSYDYWVIKLDGTGQTIEWQNTIGGSDSDYLNSIQQTTDGGYILGGHSYSGISGDKTEANQGSADYWVVKLDGTGNIEWQNTIGGSDGDYLNSIQQTTDGGYILGGYSKSGISGDKTEARRGNRDYWIVKLDGTGNIVWQNTIGGSDNDRLYSIRQTTDGGYILGGYSKSDISGDKTEANQGSADYWVVKLDGTGQTIEWQNTIGGSGSDYLYSIQQTTDGGYILGGHSSSVISGDKTEGNQGSNSSDYWVIKLDGTGNIVWQNTIGGNDNDLLYSIQQTDDGGYILGGNSDSGISGDKTEANQGNRDYWIVKLDADRRQDPLTNQQPFLYGGKVSPESGHDQTEYAFKVIYTDADDDRPLYVTVTIDNNQPVHMSTEEDEKDYLVGVVYKYSTNLTTGVHTYHFSASDGFEEAQGDITVHQGPTVSNSNAEPVLSDGKVYPETGNPSTEFSFSVIYSDSDNDACSEIFLNIDNGPPQPMTPISQSDDDNIDGVVYEYRTRLDIGTHTYSFSASDWTANAIGDTYLHSGPTIYASGGSPNLSNGNVTPQVGTTETEFTFEILYISPDNQPPSEITVQIGGQLESMVPPMPSETNYTEGVMYQFKTTLDLGEHSYSFAAKSESIAADGDIVSHTGPIVSTTIPISSWNGTTDQGKQISFTVSENFNSVLDFIFSVSGERTILVPVGTESCGPGCIRYLYDWRTYYGTVSGTIPQMNIINNNFQGTYTSGSSNANVSGNITWAGTAEGNVSGSENVSSGYGGDVRVSGSATWSASNASLFSSIIINEPNNGQLLSSLSVTVSGMAKGALVHSAKINDTVVQLTNGNFSTNVSLIEGINPIQLIAFDVDENTVGTYRVQVTVDNTPPVITITEPTDGIEIIQQEVNVTGTVDDPTILSINVNDEPVCISEGRFNTIVSLKFGLNNIIAEAYDQAGNRGHYSITVNFVNTISVDETANSSLPLVYSLSQNYPNPFNPTTTFHYDLPKESQVSIAIYDMLGREVNRLIKQKQPSGSYSVQWNGDDNNGNLVGTGIYFYQLQAGDFVQTKKMVLLK